MKIQEERVLLLMEENGITQRKMAQDSRHFPNHTKWLSAWKISSCSG